jgi:hypothetical protein
MHTTFLQLKKKTGGGAGVQRLPTKHKALGSIPSTKKKDFFFLLSFFTKFPIQSISSNITGSRKLYLKFDPIKSKENKVELINYCLQFQYNARTFVSAPTICSI